MGKWERGGRDRAPVSRLSTWGREVPLGRWDAWSRTKLGGGVQGQLELVVIKVKVVRGEEV